ncbi:MAG: hypothetical protein ABSA26_13945 [Thermoguttaceae bacterium]
MSSSIALVVTGARTHNSVKVGHGLASIKTTAAGLLSNSCGGQRASEWLARPSRLWASMYPSLWLRKPRGQRPRVARGIT